MIHIKTREELENTVRKIKKTDNKSRALARAHWDQIAKPIDGLGDLEEMIVKIAGMIGTPKVELKKRTAIVMCADNGIVEEGVTQTGSEVTGMVAAHMAEGKACISRMCQYAGIEVWTVDVGIKEDPGVPGLLPRNVRRGTRNFLKEPAMTEKETLQAISYGMELVETGKEHGVQLFLTGEMGIGNTTTSSAVTAALLGVDPKSVTGKGAGLSKEQLKHKQEVILQGLKKYDFLGKETPDPLKVLSCVGGLDIAGLVGVFLGGALFGIPVVIDGIISACSALVAERLAPGCKDFMLASHQGKEPAMEYLLKELNRKPILHANLKQGEGTGAAMLVPLLDMALCIYLENPSFEEAKITAYERFAEGREEEI